jgi:hypothetical protein
VTVLFAFLADSANVAGDGRLNALGIFRDIFAPSYPATHNHMSLAMALDLEPIDAGRTRLVVVRFLTADGQALATVNINIEIPPPPLPPARTPLSNVVNFNSIPLPEEGDYEFNISIDDRPIFSVPLRARKQAS